MPLKGPIPLVLHMEPLFCSHLVGKPPRGDPEAVRPRSVPRLRPQRGPAGDPVARYLPPGHVGGAGDPGACGCSAARTHWGAPESARWSERRSQWEVPQVDGPAPSRKCRFWPHLPPRGHGAVGEGLGE